MKNKADAEDICQEVFVKVILADKSKVKNMKSWILRIASNECYTVLRRRKTGLLKEFRNYLLSHSDSVHSVENQFSERETKEELQSLYSRLPDKIRMVIVLRYINDLTVPEIAKILDIPEGTVKSRLSRGIKMLNKMVAPQPKEMNVHESLH